MTLAPWEYLFHAFNAFNFPDLFWPTVWASIAALAATVVLYNLRTRQLHRHRPYLDLWEWLLWTGLIWAVLGVVNPALNARIDWPWFIASQIAFGLAAGFVISRAEPIGTMQTWLLAARAGVEATGVD